MNKHTHIHRHIDAHMQYSFFPVDDSILYILICLLPFHVIHFGVNSLSTCKALSHSFFLFARCSTPWMSMVYLTGLLVVDIKVLFPIFTLQRMVQLLNIFKHHLHTVNIYVALGECLLRQL